MTTDKLSSRKLSADAGLVGEAHAPMPIMLGPDIDLAVRREPLSRVHVRSIPWAIIDGDVGRRQADMNHGQTLEGLASRDGLNATEALAIILGLPWRQSLHDEQICHRLLYAMTSLYRRGVLAGCAAVAAPDTGSAEERRRACLDAVLQQTQSAGPSATHVTMPIAVMDEVARVLTAPAQQQGAS